MASERRRRGAQPAGLGRAGCARAGPGTGHPRADGFKWRLAPRLRACNDAASTHAAWSTAMPLRSIVALCLGVLAMADNAESAPAEPAGRIVGIGGVFFKAKDPKALAAWYRDVLGMPVQAWGGAALRLDAPGHPPAAAWSAFPASTTYFAPSTGDFMIDYAVDDLDALLARLHARGVEILQRDDSDANGRFAWLLDPEGHKVELWEPRRAAP
jgi:catechol 2,3-dioxygenase-like lactoylglutathione lyase family enzyme